MCGISTLFYVSETRLRGENICLKLQLAGGRAEVETMQTNSEGSFKEFIIVQRG
jgi:hypothetical protein